MSYFEVLPDELVLHIFSKFHSIKDLKNASITCEKFCGIFSNLPSEFWRGVLAAQWYLNETELAYMPDKDWREVIKALVRSEQEILADQSLEGETLHALVTYVRCSTLGADLLDANSATESLLKHAVINLRKDYVVEVGSAQVAKLLRLNVPQLLVSLLGVIPRVPALSALIEETVLSVYELFGNKQVGRESIPYGILTNLRKHIEHESSLHVQRITFVYWSLAELETLLPLFLKLGYIPLLSNIMSQYEDKEIQQSVLGFLTWFQKTGNFDVEVDKSKNLVPKMLDIFAAPDNGNMELRETASRAIRTTIGYEGGTKALKTFIACNGIERSLDLLNKISEQAASDAKAVEGNYKTVPTHVSIVVEVIVTLHCCISFISSDHMRTNLIHESVQRLEPYFDALIQYISFPHPVVRKKAIDFWMSCMCAKIPAPEVNKKIMAALVHMVKTETAFKMRIRYFSLAANIAVTDDSVFCSEDARTLGEVWIEGFLSEDMHKLEGDTRWLLYLIPGSLFQFEEFQKITAAKPRALAKMKQFASAENTDLVNRFRATLALSYMYQTGTLDESVLPLINDFAMQVPHTVAWRLVFSKIKPYWHLFPSQRVELLALVAWLLAHTSLTEIGKVAINTELDWSVVARLEASEHPRIQELVKIFRQNMNKLSSYFTIWESSGTGDFA